MNTFKLTFWLNLSLVVATCYIIIWYVFTPSNNTCQMTFMMEPPRFLPIPVDTSPNDGSLSYPETNIKGKSDSNRNKYKLYMYSELGFPQETNIGRDLKDSMPVLFVPGNAGSYQQVRSIASTCIRQQLQSLEAFKFIFYTIDFQGELSGIDGQLIEEQTTFVHQSLNQIIKIHPSDTNGVILIGHSVGGFISKVLFTRPNFDSSSVPLLISLASPLTKPYLSFDNKMLELYKKTNEYWSENESKLKTTIALSISGGKSDRLVPEHLSLDPQYDLSLTTSSVKDVWLATDHVCITWCRELMNKLANLLSSLMDKKQTRLISNKEKAMSIIIEQLSTEKHNTQQENITVINKDWRTIRPTTIVKLQEAYTASRLQLSKNILIVDISETSSSSELFIFIDHLGSLRENGLFGCQEVDFNKTTETVCRGIVDLTNFAHIIATPRFEPKRTLYKLKYSGENLIRYIVLDFVASPDVDRYGKENKLPETLTIQRTNENLQEQTLYIPTLIEYFLTRLLFIDPYVHRLRLNRNLPLFYMKYNLMNLNDRTQILSIRYESKSCSTETYPKRATILINQDDQLAEYLYIVPFEKGSLGAEIKIKRQKCMLGKGEKSISGHSSLEFYIDGACETYLTVELNLLDLVVQSIQRDLGEILTCTTFLAYISIPLRSRFLIQQVPNASLLQDALRLTISLLGYISIDIVSSYYSLKPAVEDIYYNSTDRLTSYIIILILSLGARSFIDYFLRRLVDLATIIDRLQLLARQRITSTGVSTSNGTRTKEEGEVDTIGMEYRFISSDIDWILIGLVLAGSFVFSTAIVSLFTLFIMIRIELYIASRRSKLMNKCSNIHCLESHKADEYEITKIDNVHELLVSVAVLCSLALISNVPKALLRLNKCKSLKMIMTTYELKDETFFAAALALFQVKKICSKFFDKYFHIEMASKSNSNTQTNQHNKILNYSLTRFIYFLLIRHAHLLTLVPILFIQKNLGYINLVFTSIVIWLYFQVEDKSVPSTKNCNKNKNQ